MNRNGHIGGASAGKLDFSTTAGALPTKSAWPVMPAISKPCAMNRPDTDFNDAANLPPLSPRFVYLRQTLFQREFEL